MNQEIEEFLNEGLVLKSEFWRSLKLYNEYFPGDEGKFLITRSDVNKGGSDFRSFLEGRVKSIKTRNRIILTLERFFAFLIQYREVIQQPPAKMENPFSRTWDYFRTENYKGTKRIALSPECLDNIKMVLLEKEACSVRNLIYTLLCLPLRGLQAQLLDSGLSDEWIFENNEMVKNPKGIKGRSQGVFKLINGKKYFFINTNKNGMPYLIPCLDSDLWQILRVQRESVRELSGLVGRAHKVKINMQEFDLLFRNKDGSGIKKNQLYNYWSKICAEVEDRFGWELTKVVKGKRKFLVDLHSLRVSLVTALLDKEELGVVSQHIVGHENSKMTIAYLTSNKSLSLEIKAREKLIEYQE